MSTVQVLCPNGRRQNVKVTPNTKLLQVLEDVCQKQKLLPAEDYKLVQGVARSTLDLTLSVRFANLPNNAKLEMVRLEKSRTETQVIIAVQLESGERLQHSFLPGTSLWDILLHFENEPDSSHKGQLTSIDGSQSPALHPVCVYMREEVTGAEALKDTKLRTLGLTGGKAAIRLFHRPINDEKLASIKATLDKEKERKARLERSASSSSGTATVTTKTSEVSVQTPTTVQVEQGASCTTKTETGTISLNINVNIQGGSQLSSKVTNEERDKGEPANKMVKMDTSQIPVETEPMEVEATGSTDVVMETEPTPQVVSATYGQAQREAAQSLRDMNIPGLEIFTPDDFAAMSTQEQHIARRLAANILPRFLEQKDSASGQDTSQESVTSSQPSFVDFKFPEETKGKNLQQTDKSLVKKEDFRPCDREPILFSVEDSSQGEATNEAVSSTTDLPDDFFEITEQDLKVLIAAQKKSLRMMEDQPLMTTSMRRARLDEIYSQYDKVAIRVHFQDKLVLQGLFRPRETVFAVKKFVKEFLSSKDLPFYLYTAPPKCILKEDAETLIQAKLVPATVVYFGCDQHKDHYLSETALADIKSRQEADIAFAQCLRGLDSVPVDPESQQISKGKQPAGSKVQPKSSSRAFTTPASSTSTSSSSTEGSSKQVPKWFKIGKK